MERVRCIHSNEARVSMIVPLSGHSTIRMKPLIKKFYLTYSSCHIVNLSADAHPSKLFEGVKFRLAVFNVSNSGNGLFTTKYRRWFAEERPCLFNSIRFTQNKHIDWFDTIPKIDNPIMFDVIKKIYNDKNFFLMNRHGDKIWYHNCPVNWIRAHSYTPFFTSERDGDGVSTQLKPLYFATKEQAEAGQSILCSTLFFIWWIIQSDCYHLTNRELGSFRYTTSDDASIVTLSQLSQDLSKDMDMHSRRRVYNYKTSGRVEYDEFYMKESKAIIDKIDAALASHFGLTNAEYDYIANYDIKYRMG
jgi:hypothetical protein